MTIYFDKNCVYWSDDDKMNEHFLNCQADYIRELVRNRGYIYIYIRYMKFSVLSGTLDRIISVLRMQTLQLLLDWTVNIVDG